MSLKARILGCGSSGGVPRIGNNWGACDPSNPRNRRTRCSLLLTRTGGAGITSVLIDTSPDLREQLIAAECGQVDSVIYTHDHADQCHGIDDLRALALIQRSRVPIWADMATRQTLTERFGYCFQAPEGSPYPPILEMNAMEVPSPVIVSGEGGTITAQPFRVVHGATPTLGFRIGGLAYTPDLNTIRDEDLGALDDLDCWIVDALRRTPHPTHFSLDDALSWIERVKPKRAVVTNMHVDLDYETLCKELPAHVVPAYDGLEIEIATK
ncbi:MAG: MBL fold metallo-hydrolase [Pseudomonadota bacterium]